MEHRTGFSGRAAQVVLLAAAVALQAGCAGKAEPPPSPRYGVHHCYKTLANVDCHAVALVDEPTRREGWFESPLED